MHRPPRWLSRYHSLDELIASSTASARGIDNEPPPLLLAPLRRLARGLDEVRTLLGHPLELTSGYRSAALNVAVGGVANSQHSRGEAADFTCEAFGPPVAIARAIEHSAIAFDQCILEYGRWIHLSFSAAPRRRVLSIHDDGRGYVAGILERATG